MPPFEHAGAAPPPEAAVKQGRKLSVVCQASSISCVDQLAARALSNDGEASGRTVDSHVARVRKKLGPDAGAAIKTVWGIGYSFTPDKSA